MTEKDYQELRRWARDMATEAAEWQMAVFEGEGDETGDAGDCLNEIENQSNALIRLLDKR